MHCKDISVRRVGVPITSSSIEGMMSDWTAYKRAEYVVLEHGEEHAVIRLRKSPDGDLFRRVTGYDVVSLPEDTVFVERPDMDVLNVPSLARLQQEFPGKAVVVRGLFSHVSFVKDLRPLRLTIVDAVPPYPSKLSYLVRTALSSGYVELPVVTEERDIDMSELAERAETEEVMFPCEASGLRTGRPHCFLDQVPDIGDRPITLVGCRLSRRIFWEEYGRDVPLINFCPQDNVPESSGKVIAKCCRVKRGHEMHGDTAVVPWGATVPEVVDAINDLFSDYVPDADLPLEK